AGRTMDEFPAFATPWCDTAPLPVVNRHSLSLQSHCKSVHQWVGPELARRDLPIMRPALALLFCTLVSTVVLCGSPGCVPDRVHGGGNGAARVLDFGLSDSDRIAAV